METKITNNYFKFETNKFFRGNAHNARIGAFGKKKDPIGAKSYLDVENNVSPEYLESRVKYNTTAEVNWNQANKADVEADRVVKYFGIGGEVAMNGSYEKAKSANLKLMSFAIDEGPLKSMLNKDANGVRKYLASEGNDGRIVSEVWVLVEGEIAETFSTAASISVSGKVPGKALDINANGGKNGMEQRQDRD